MIPVDASFWLYAEIAMICFLLSAAWYCSVALFFSSTRVAGQFLRFKSGIERVMGAALIVLGGRLLWSR